MTNNIQGDNIQGDKIQGDKIGGDKVLGNKYETYYHAPPPPDPEQILEKAITRFNQLPLDTIPDPAPDSLTEDSRIVLSHNPNFVGRHEALRKIAAALKNNETALITGIGGIGKTQLAAEFAHRYGRYFKGGVFWLSFADPAAVPAEIVACGRNMELPGLHALDIDEQVKMVLSEWEEPVPRLLICDNCTDENLFDHYRPKAGGVRILVTSRRGRWSPGFSLTTLALNQLTRAESIQLLQRFWQPLTDDEAGAIAASLGDHPLALHLAGSYLAFFEGSVNPTEFPAELKKAGPFHEALAGKIEGHSPTGHEQNVADTFSLSYQRLSTDSFAHRILVQLANLAPGEPVSDNLLQLLASAGAGPTASKELTLARRHLISLGLVTAEPDRALRLHRLLHHFVRCVVDETVLEEVQSEIEYAVNREAARLNDTGIPAPLLAWQNQLRYLTETALSRQDKQSAALASNLGHHLRLVADYGGAKTYFEKALTIREGLQGADHPDTAESLNNLGALLQAMGDLNGARPLYERALSIRQQSLGPENPDTAESLNNLGYLLRAMGDLAGARPYYEQALAIFQKQLGPSHPDTATSLNNLGYLLQTMDNLEEAKPYYQQALAIREEVFGADHPMTAQSLNNLGYLLRKMGRLAEAQPHIERALAINQQLLGPNHPQTALSLHNLGGLFLAAGNIPEAGHYFEQALAIRKESLGPNHPLAANTLTKLGETRQAAGDREQAKQAYEQAQAIYQEKLGPNHPDTLLVRQKLASLGDFHA